MTPVRIRMYRQGLGDCFLLSFPRPGGAAHVLIDCGVVAGTPDATARMVDVAESVVATTGGRLDALVVTHPHWDHVSGFVQARAVFDRIRVGEVWLAWTEDPADDLARDLAGRRETALAAVAGAARRLAREADPEAARMARRLDGLLRFHGARAAADWGTAAAAMDWVRGRTGARVRYFQPGQDPVRVPGADGVRVYVLGPSRDPAALRRADPAGGREGAYGMADLGGPCRGFLAAVAPGGGVDIDGQPFDPWYRVTEADAWADEFFGDHYGFEGEDDQGWRRIESDWLGAAGQLALRLDSHTNNTSLALAFELLPSGRVLLFPGDAQAGNWRSWAGREWRVKDGAETRRVTAADLLARTAVYKVGHHGSHGGTPVDGGLERMTSRELTALLPVDRAAATAMGWAMPAPALYRRLLQQTGGRILDLETGRLDGPPPGVGDREWARFVAHTEVRPAWVDYMVEA